MTPTTTPFVDAAPLSRRDVKFTVSAPDNTPTGTQVWLLVMAFTDWEWSQHVPMKSNGDGTWFATASLEEGALVHYAYDIWDEREWSQFKDMREAAARGVPVDRRLLYVSERTTSVSDVVASWRDMPAAAKTGTIIGRVTGPTGAPVIDSDVTVAGIHAATDWDGRFRIEAASGTQRVTVYRADWAHRPVAAEVEVPPGGEVAANIGVQAAAEVPVTFRVRLPSDTPRNAEIRLTGSALQLGSDRGGVNTPYLMSSSLRLPVLRRTGADIAEGTFTLRAGAYVQYFYTMTSDGLGREWAGPQWNQRFRSTIVGDVPTTRDDRVESWRNPDWPTITFRVTVPPNTPDGLPIVFEMGPGHYLTKTGPRTWELTISSIPDTSFRYRYLLGGDGAGSDGSAGTGIEREGYRTASLGTTDIVVNDTITRWANLPASAEAAQGTRVRVTFNVSVPHTTPVGTTSVRWVPQDGSPAADMNVVDGNPWMYRAEVDLPAGRKVSYYVQTSGARSGRSPTREATPTYEGQIINDWVATWGDNVAGTGTRPGYLAGYYTPDFWSRAFLSLSDTTYESIAAHNGNLVAVSSVWSYGRIKPLPLIESRSTEAPSVLTPRQDIVDQIAIAHRQGLQVLLAPQFNMEMSPGGINALNDNSTAWWDEWLVQAERVWMWNAQVAQESKAEMLLLPGFVFHVFAQPWAFESPEAFKTFDGKVASLVERVRSVYKGKILISGGVRESQVPGMADYVGVTTYDTGHPELPATATVQEWRAAYERLFTEKLDPIRKQWGKPVFFYTIHLPPQEDDPEKDGQALQARRLEGLMQAIDSRLWVTGSMSWAYSMGPAPLAQGDGLRGRLAEAVLAKYYARFTGNDYAEQPRGPKRTEYETPPVLTRSIVDLAGVYNPTTRRLGALDCNFVIADSPDDRWCASSFGATLRPGKVIGSFDYKVVAGSTVYSASSGAVDRVSAKEDPNYPGEYEIHVRTSPGSRYIVIYDHVRELRVKLGSEVEPGTVLGVAGIHRTDPARWGRVELQVNFYPNPRELRENYVICPAVFGSTEFVAAHNAALAAHNSANPAFAHPELCVVESIAVSPLFGSVDR